MVLELPDGDLAAERGEDVAVDPALLADLVDPAAHVREGREVLVEHVLRAALVDGALGRGEHGGDAGGASTVHDGEVQRLADRSLLLRDVLDALAEHERGGALVDVLTTAEGLDERGLAGHASDDSEFDLREVEADLAEALGGGHHVAEVDLEGVGTLEHLVLHDLGQLLVRDLVDREAAGDRADLVVRGDRGAVGHVVDGAAVALEVRAEGLLGLLVVQEVLDVLVGSSDDAQGLLAGRRLLRLLGQDRGGEAQALGGGLEEDLLQLLGAVEVDVDDAAEALRERQLHVLVHEFDEAREFVAAALEVLPVEHHDLVLHADDRRHEVHLDLVDERVLERGVVLPVEHEAPVGVLAGVLDDAEVRRVARVESLRLRLLLGVVVVPQVVEVRHLVTELLQRRGLETLEPVAAGQLDLDHRVREEREVAVGVPDHVGDVVAEEASDAVLLEGHVVCHGEAGVDEPPESLGRAADAVDVLADVVCDRDVPSPLAVRDGEADHEPAGVVREESQALGALLTRVAGLDVETEGLACPDETLDQHLQFLGLEDHSVVRHVLALCVDSLDGGARSALPDRHDRL